MTNISIVIIAKNAQKHIKDCLESVTVFDDVVLYLNDCSDETKSIASTFSNINIIDGYFDGFGPTKNRAATFAKNNWVFTLDSDEILSDSLIQELQELQLQNDTLYAFKRLNHYNKKAIRCCGWENDTVVRLYNKTETSYHNKAVHESIIDDKFKITTLNNQLYHYPFDNIKQLIQKADYYSELYADAHTGKKGSSVSKAVTHSLFMFFKSYFLKRGFLNGFEGFLIAYFNAFGSALKYLKLYEKNKL